MSREEISRWKFQKSRSFLSPPLSTSLPLSLSLSLSLCKLCEIVRVVNCTTERYVHQKNKFQLGQVSNNDHHHHHYRQIRFVLRLDYIVWLGGAVVGRRTRDQQVPGSIPGRRAFEIRVQPWASCLHTYASVIKQYNLVPAQAGKLTVRLASDWPCVTNNSGICTYRLTAYVREMSTPPTLQWSRVISYYIVVSEDKNKLKTKTQTLKKQAEVKCLREGFRFFL